MYLIKAGVIQIYRERVYQHSDSHTAEIESNGAAELGG